MSLDLVDRFKELSVSSAKLPTLNKKPLNIRCDPDEFSAFDSFKYSTRIFLNFKDMLTMGLKAGSLVKLISKGVEIDNIFEVWPSIFTDSGNVTFGCSNTSSFISVDSNSTLDIVSVNLSKSPVLVAKNIKLHYFDSDKEKYTEYILQWLRVNIFPEKCKCFFIAEGKEIQFSLEVSNGSPNFIYRFIQSETLFEECNSKIKKTKLTFGGLENQFEELVNITTAFLKPEQNIHNIKLPHGVLLYGPPGCGKTMLVNAVSSFINVPVVNITASDFASGGYGEAELKLSTAFESAKAISPCIIFMDEIDSLCPKRDNSSSASTQRITTLLLTLMDGCSNISSKSLVFFIGATNIPSSLDSALRRPGRFDREIEISPPSSKERFSILKSILNKYPNSVDENDLKSISDIAHGYVGSDLNLLCKEAYILSIKSTSNDSFVPSICTADLMSAMSKIKPSAMREVFIEVPKVKWSDIGGQQLTKQKLIECVEWPMKFPEKFKKLGINPPKGILLFGPPGCSKTLLAKALASESGLNFLAVKGPEIFSKFIGESEKRISEIFKKARQASPSIIFFDEFDSIAGRSEGGEGSASVTNRVMSQLLNEMDGLEPLVNVIIIAATNKPDLIDKALLRPGRFDRHIYISLPDYEGRMEIFRILMRKMPFSEDFNPEIVASLTEGFSGAEITSLCQNSAIRSLERDISSQQIEWEDFELCLSKFEKQINYESLKIFEKFIE